MKREKLTITILLALFGFTVLLALSNQQLLKKEARMGLTSDVVSSKGIALLQLKGPISFSDPSQFMNAYSAESVLEQLEAVAEDKRVKGVLIRINSPGGTVGASQELYKGIKRLKEKTGMPIVASIADVGASGAYYTAMATDTIFANPGSLVGSIGVIMSSFNLEKLAQRFGVDVAVYKSGAHKDILSSWRQSTVEEKALLQALIDNVHTQFVKDFSQSRKIDIQKAITLADGRFYSGQQAKEVGLVDHLAGLQEAIDYTAKKAGIEGKPLIIRKARRGLGSWVSMLKQETASMLLSLIPIGPQFY